MFFNGKCVDCFIYLLNLFGLIVIDSKFLFEVYEWMINVVNDSDFV